MFAFGPDGSMYFTDSGPLGETTLQNPLVAAFVLPCSRRGQGQISSFYSRMFAHPGIAVGPGVKIYMLAKCCGIGFYGYCTQVYGKRASTTNFLERLDRLV